MTSLVGKGDLRLIAELLQINYNTLKREASRANFPLPVQMISNIRIFDVSEVAKYMGVPLRSK